MSFTAPEASFLSPPRSTFPPPGDTSVSTTICSNRQTLTQHLFSAEHLPRLHQESQKPAMPQPCSPG